MALGTKDKIRENRLRAAAIRQGLRLMRSRARDPRALTFGTYQLVDRFSNTIVAGHTSRDGYGLNLDQVERELTR